MKQKDTLAKMETSDKEEETNVTPMELVLAHKPPQKHKNTTQSTLGEAFGVATQIKKGKKGKKKSNQISQSSQSQAEESVESNNTVKEEEMEPKGTVEETSTPKKLCLRGVKQTLMPTIIQEHESFQLRVIFLFQGMQTKDDKGDGLKLVLQKIAEDIHKVDLSSWIAPWEAALDKRYPLINYTLIDSTDRNVLYFYILLPERGPFL